MNESDPIDPIWTAEQIQGSNRDIVYLAPLPGIDQNSSMDLYTAMKDYAGSDDPTRLQTAQDGSALNVLPVKNFTIPVDPNIVSKNGTVNPTDTIQPQLNITINKRALYKNESAIINIIAANKWQRPIYFTSPYEMSNLGFGPYLRQDGMTYRLVPVANSEVNREWVMDKMMNKFSFGNADKPGVYFDEENRRHLNSIRMAYASAANNMADAGRMEDAKKLLNKCDAGMLPENMPYGMASRSQQHNSISMQLLLAAYKAGDDKLVQKINTALRKDMTQQQSYYEGLRDNHREALQYEEQRNMQLLQALSQLEQEFKGAQTAPAEGSTPIQTNPVAKVADSVQVQPTDTP